MKNTTDKIVSPAVEPFTYRVATAVSFVANPLFVAIPTFLIIALSTTSNLLQGLLWWGVTAGGISLAPLLFVARGVRNGRYSDHHVSVREQRLVPLLFGIICFCEVFFFLIVLHTSPVLIATVTAALVALAIATVVTQYWKISLHLVGIAGTATVFLLLFGTVALVLSPRVFLVAWARWQVRAHTLLQALAGTVLAVSVTVLTFWFFGLL